MTAQKWTFDEFKHIGVDFADPEQVKTYDARQTSIEREKQLVERLGITAADTVIEFGPGTGAFSLAAAATGAQVTAVDISKAMLDYGRSKASGLANIEFVHGGFLSYQHQGQPATFVVTKFALHHLPDFWKAIALRRIHSMMQANGTFYLRDVVFSFPADEAARHLNAWIDAVADDGGQGFSRADFEMHIRDEYSTFGWIMEGILQQAGFTITNASYESPTYAEYICLKR